MALTLEEFLAIFRAELAPIRQALTSIEARMRSIETLLAETKIEEDLDDNVHN